MATTHAKVRDTRERITEAAGVFATQRSMLNREHLSRLMRRALAQGIRREHVIALSVLPHEEAEELLQ